ncbi:MAG: glycosyltransferase family 4 protein [Bacteroidales bacterium]|nr:glycosyltransferase family 4 protein [Bacteroidales bacterium]
MNRILHLDTGPEWRGGQRQVLLLHEGLLQYGFESHLAAYQKGVLFSRSYLNVLPIPSRNEFSLRSILTLSHYIRQLKPQIVHTHDAHSLTLALFASYFTPSFILINTRRVDFPAIKNRFSKWKYKHSKLKVIVSVSEAIRKILLREDIQPEKLEVIHSGIEPIDPEKFSCPIELKKVNSKEGVIFGCVASFADHKDHFTLIKAFDLVYQQQPNTYLVLVGDGELRKQVEAFARRFNCYNNIVFTGFRDDVYSMYKCFDVFVLTSKEEGLCTALLDAMQFGLPIVATHAGGIPEIVHHEKNGLLCEIRNPSDIAQKMLLLAKNNSLRIQLGQNGKKMVKNFYYDSMISKYISLYEKLLKK